MTTLANMLAAAQRLLSYYNGDEKTAQNPGGLTGVGGMADNWDPCIQDIGTVANGVGDAMTAASTSEGNAAASATAAAGSAQSAQQDAQATAADRQATGQDRQATAADRQAVAQDKTAVHQDRLAADADAQATAADRLAVAQDKTAVHQDRLAADADAQATAADRLATQADRQQTGLDRQAAQQAAANAQTWDPTAYLKKTGDTISAAIALVMGTITNLFVGTNGRVGIGTNAPGAELEVADTSGDNDVRVNLRASAGVIGQIGRSTTAMFIDTVLGHAFQFFIGGFEQVRVQYVASANRYITLSGSNGGAPTVSTSAGDLKLTSATGVVQVGTVGPVQQNVAQLAAAGNTFTPDCNLSNEFECVTTAGGTTITANSVIANPTNVPAAGKVQPLCIKWTQDATGGRTMSFGANCINIGGTSANTSAGKTNFAVGKVYPNGKFYYSIVKGAA